LAIIKNKGELKVKSINQLDFRIICSKVGYDLTDSELISLKSGFEDACRMIQPLYEIDLTDTEIVLKFHPAIGIDR
jgi:hypothetical protein|tara:strand:+ start:183 stop:410 length:228 start_codon:yes stop_codon:yes gene_type:complete